MVLSLLFACATLTPQGGAPAALPTPAAPDRPIGQRPPDDAPRLLAPLSSPPPASRFAALDGLVALYRDTTIAVIDGTSAWRWDGAGPPAVLASASEHLARTADGSHLALDATGQRLGTGGSGVVELWDVAEGVRLWATPSSTADERVAVLEDGAVLAAGAVDGGAGRVVRFTPDGRIARAWDGGVLRAGAAAAFSPDGRTIALVDRDQLRLLDSATGIEVGALGLPDRPTEYPAALAWSADGEALVAAWTTGRSGGGTSPGCGDPCGPPSTRCDPWAGSDDRASATIRCRA